MTQLLTPPSFSPSFPLPPRRIARVRKAVKLVQGEKKKYHKKLVDAEIAAKDEKTLQIPLMTAERAWAYAMQLKFETNTEPRKRFHMLNR